MAGTSTDHADGTGWCGQTRLALEAARLGSDRFADGVWFCPLAPVGQGEAVAHSVAAALLVRLQDRLTVTESIVDAIRGRQLLVVLDNCEHVLDAVAELATRLATSCPTVSVLTTSREPLDVAVELVWPVRPLRPEAEGTKLFYERASAADVEFTATPTDMSTITTICERLDGIPLAIELAAARMRSMTAADVAERLDDRFRLLRAERRGNWPVTRRWRRPCSGRTIS